MHEDKVLEASSFPEIPGIKCGLNICVSSQFTVCLCLLTTTCAILLLRQWSLWSVNVIIHWPQTSFLTGSDAFSVERTILLMWDENNSARRNQMIWANKFELCHFFSASFTSVNISIWVSDGNASSFYTMVNPAGSGQPLRSLWATWISGDLSDGEEAMDRDQKHEKSSEDDSEHLSPWLSLHTVYIQCLHAVGRATFFTVLHVTIKEASRMQNSEAVVKIQLENGGCFRRLECFSHHVLFTS